MIEQQFIDRAKGLIFDKLAEHPDEGVRAINALTGPLPDDDPRVLEVAEALQAKASRA